MHKVVIVDDDRIIRRGLIQTIPWEENGIKVVGEAGDGEKGLELIRSKNPQIVVSDIKMPFMNGLEMAQKIRGEFPTMKIILLTGYDDFKYAQEAIKIRAFDYLLKPVDSLELVRKVKEAAIELDKEVEAISKLNDALPLLQQEFLKNLIYGKIPESEIQQSLFEELNLNLKGPFYATIIASSREEKDSFYTGEIKKLSTDLVVTRKDDIQGIEFIKNQYELVMIFSFFSLVDNNFLKKLAEELKHLLKHHIDVDLTISLGNLYKGVHHLSTSFKEARMAMDFSHVFGKQRIISVSDIILSDKKLNVILKGEELELLQKISLGLVCEVEAFYENLQKLLLNQYHSLQDVHFIALKLLIALNNKASHDAVVWVEDTNFDLTSLYQEIYRLHTIQDIIEKLEDLSVSLAHYLQAENSRRKVSVVDMAISFLEENYHQERLSLQKISSKVHVSPAYLSNLFKVEKGKNFGEFLLEIRMEKAMELIRKENLKTYEVAEKVGYSNPQYFSICFKKYTNYSPAEFKKLS